jgi:hypothetical protein
MRMNIKEKNEKPIIKKRLRTNKKIITINVSELSVYGHEHRCTQIFTKLVNKNAIKVKHQKGVPSPKNFHNPYTLPPKIWQKPHGPSLRIFKPCASMDSQKILSLT